MTKPTEKCVGACWSDQGAHTYLLVKIGLVVHTWHEGIQFDLLRNLRFVGQELDLSDMDCALELKDDLLRVDAKSL